MKIWYISRTYLPEKTGGALIRIAQVDFFKSQGAEVVVVAPNYVSRESIVSQDEIRLPYRKSTIRVDQAFERLGLYEDYLDRWVVDSLALLKERVRKEDYVFATSGGELGCIKLGSKLKDMVDCKFVVNLHDPVDYTWVGGRKINNLPHVNREGQERRYLQNADLVITSSESNRASLVDKYPEMATRIRCSYFGFITRAKLQEKVSSTRLTIVYGGTYDKNQSPELLSEVVRGIETVEAHFVGNHAAYMPLDFARNTQANCRFIAQLSYPDFLRYLTEHADMGFVSLASPYLGACVPSKMFEYINIGLPIFGALPPGDAREIINAQGYGIACSFDDAKAQRDAILEISADVRVLQKYREQILRDRNDWHMPARMTEVHQWLQDL
jgi:glycosyltransferase involved in cell wall biosynthesis